ncbi:hypothetical protein [Streptomyces sp. NPDC006193]|uniref:hypothetical protein n=1 Tax=Streptomyces sp. NPDC006193 TaxID=3155717 RepID=UPI0033B137D0
MQAVFDPTARIAPARTRGPARPPRSFTEGAEALLARLDAPPQPEPDRPPHADLPLLRLVTVRLSFVSAFLTAACVPLLAKGLEWPLFVVGAGATVAAVLIIAFFASLRYTIARRAKAQELHHQHMKQMLEGMARERVVDLEDRQLIERSRSSPELTSAILATILTEYAEAERLPAADRPRGGDTMRTLSLPRVLAVAGPQHPLARALRRLATDVRTTDTSEAH